MNAIRSMADHIIDTSDLTVHQLRQAFKTFAFSSGDVRGRSGRLAVTLLLDTVRNLPTAYMDMMKRNVNLGFSGGDRGNAVDVLDEVFRRTEGGTLGNTHFVAIPVNADAAAGALEPAADHPGDVQPRTGGGQLFPRDL